jgi:hypothetical protein
LNFHGDVGGSQIPVYGNKVLGVTSGTLDIHGAPRKVTKALLETTAEENHTSITLHGITPGDFDWVTGDEILIVTTSLDGKQSEVRTIDSVTDGTTANPVIHFTQGLLFKH